MTPDALAAQLRAVPESERDGWVDTMLACDELLEDGPLPRGCVPYLPCAVDTLVEALERAAVTDDDVFVDVGAGIGRTVLLAHLLTGARCIGLEIQPPMVQAARGRAAELGLSAVSFVEGDAVELVRVVDEGTVYFMYCPFGRDRLDPILTDLEGLARRQPIRVCCVGMPPLQRAWLEAMPATSVDLAVYQSTY